MSKNLKTLSIAIGLTIFITTGFLIFQNFRNSPLPSDSDSTSGSSAESFKFPESLQGFTLSQSNSGPQAITMISQLHGTNIKIKEGYIGQYDGASGQIMVWISESGSDKEASELFEIMDQKITAADNAAGSSGNGPPFSDRRPMNRGKISVVAVKGMEMENYYYKIGSKVYWLAIGGVDPVKVLDEFLAKTSR